MSIVVVNPWCRKCGRTLVDQSDLWAGLCNNDEACAKRQEDMSMELDFIVWCPERDETEADAQRIRAIDTEEAARRWAEHDDVDTGDGSIAAKGGRPVVHVRPADHGGPETRWRVRGEWSPDYYADEVKEGEVK